MQTKNAPKNEAMYKKFPIAEEIFQKMNDLYDAEQQLTKVMLDVFKPGKADPEDMKFLYSLFLTVDYAYKKNEQRTAEIMNLLNQVMASAFSKEGGQRMTSEDMQELADRAKKMTDDAMKEGEPMA